MSMTGATCCWRLVPRTAVSPTEAHRVYLSVVCAPHTPHRPVVANHCSSRIVCVFVKRTTRVAKSESVSWALALSPATQRAYAPSSSQRSLHSPLLRPWHSHTAPPPCAASAAISSLADEPCVPTISFAPTRPSALG